nr:hypothetical protein [Rhodococcus marinonascens]
MPARITIPPPVYFALVWGGGYLLGLFTRLGYERTSTLAFTRRRGSSKEF